MTENEVLQVFRDTGALLEGHFILRSGLHSRQFFQCALALQNMPTVEKFGEALANKVRTLDIATVVSPAMGGLVLGQEVARQLKCRFIFVEKEEGRLALRRGFKITSGRTDPDRGGRGHQRRASAGNDRHRDGRAKGNVVGVAMAVDRSNGAFILPVPMFSLLTMRVAAYPADRVPADLAAIPAMKPGSK